MPAGTRRLTFKGHSLSVKFKWLLLCSGILPALEPTGLKLIGHAGGAC